MPTATHTTRHLASALSLPLLIVSLATLAACGGGEGAEPPELAQARAEATAGPELFDARGWPLSAAPQRVPADPEARTRLGLYASARQLAWQEQIAGPYTRVFDLDGGDSLQALLEQGHQAVVQRSDGRTSYFVRANDLRAGAALVNALAELGLEDVFLLVDAASTT